MADVLPGAIASLSLSSPPLLGEEFVPDLLKDVQELTLPPLISPSLSLRVLDESTDQLPNIKLISVESLPAAVSAIYDAALRNLEQITSGDAKVVYCASLELCNNQELDYAPGDSVSLICANDPVDVNWLLDRIDFASCQNADRLFVVQSVNAKPVPCWLLPGSPATARFLLTYCCHLHCPVSRRVLRVLADCCTDCPSGEKQRKRLLQLCSRQGSSLYDSTVRAANLTLFDLLCSFPECRRIPLVRLLELLPRLHPRPYTMIGRDRRNLQFIFTRVDFDGMNMNEQAGLVRYPHRKHGTCTGWLERMWMSQECDRTFRLFLRRNLNHFQLPESMKNSLILIGAGSGLAPFLAFFEQYKSFQDELHQISPPIWLIYGCRSPETSLLMKDKLNNAVMHGIIRHCCLCFSRYKGNPQKSACLPPDLGRIVCLHSECSCVQDCIFPTTMQTELLTAHQESLAKLVVHENACIMVCGDAKGMAPAVFSAWKRLLCIYLDQRPCEASCTGSELLKKMRTDRRYLEDIWI